MSSKQQAVTLYRSILKTHARSLPLEMRSLGDAYVKSEFRLHKNVSDEAQLQKFFTEWKDYLRHIQETSRAKEVQAAGLSESVTADFGMDLDEGVQVTDEQKIQLQKLREEAIQLKKT